MADCKPCLPGHYCPQQELDPNNWAHLNEENRTNIPCNNGTYCPLSTHCINNGTYCFEVGAARETVCPAGYYCPPKTAVPLDCPTSYYCPVNISGGGKVFTGTYVPIECTLGMHCPLNTKTHRSYCP